jgi:hypothetical protein
VCVYRVRQQQVSGGCCGLHMKHMLELYVATVPVVCCHVLHQVLTADAADVGLWAQDGAAKWGVLEGSCMQVVKHQLARLLVHLRG